jgi:outer membrane beta-barrel protein
MEGRIRVLFLTGLCLLVGSGIARAAEPDEAGGARQVIKPELQRRQIDVDKIDTENFEIGIYAGLLNVEEFGTNTVLGVRVAYHLTEGIFFEAAYAKSNTAETRFERLGGAARLLTDNERELTYYNISVGYNLLPGEAFIGRNWAFNTALYVIGGVGSTRFAGDDRFTMNFGAGYRFLATDWLAIHIDVRDHIFEIDLVDKKKTVHNLETHGGVTVFF